MLNEIKSQLPTANAVVGRITIDTFHDYNELLDKMRAEINRTLGEDGRSGLPKPQQKSFLTFCFLV